MLTLHDVVRSALTAVFLLILLAIGSLLPHASVNAAAPARAAAAPGRGYYLTPETVAGDSALTACAAGYHMASFAEISNTSALRYDTDLGRTTADSGLGPPSFTAGLGWVRSGFSANTDYTTVAPTNCNVWTSASGSDYGEAPVLLPNGAVVDDYMVFGNALKCDNSQGYNIGVWCVAD